MLWVHVRPHFWARYLMLVTVTYRYWLPVNWVIKGWVIKWPVKLYSYTFFTFFRNPITYDFLLFLSCCTRFVEHWLVGRGAGLLPLSKEPLPCFPPSSLNFGSTRDKFLGLYYTMYQLFQQLNWSLCLEASSYTEFSQYSGLSCIQLVWQFAITSAGFHRSTMQCWVSELF